MTEKVEGAIAAIGAVVASVSGIEQVLVNPTETANAALFAVVYAAEGRFTADPVGSKKGLHEIYIELHKRRTDLSSDVAVLKPYIDTIAAALLAEVSVGGDQFSGTITTFGSVSYRLFSDEYAGVKTTGYRFVLEQVKILSNL